MLKCLRSVVRASASTDVIICLICMMLKETMPFEFKTTSQSAGLCLYAVLITSPWSGCWKHFVKPTMTAVIVVFQALTRD